MRVSIRTFQGIRPIKAPHLLGMFESVTANNAKLISGELRPYFNELLHENALSTGVVRTIYRYESQFWLEWQATVDVAEGPVAGDTEARFYYTGDGIPKKSNETEATTVAGPYPENFYPMASPQAKYAPAGANVGGGSGDDRFLSYVWTIVTDWGEESAPSPPSDTITAKPGDQINLTLMSTVWAAGTAYTTDDWVTPSTPNGFMYKCVVAGTSAGSEPTWGLVVDEDTTDNTVTWRGYENIIASKRIYRIIVGDTTALYLFVDEITATATTYADTKLDTQLGEQLRTGFGQYPLWTPPPDNLTNLVNMPNGIMAGSLGKDVYFSEPFFPHAWPTDYVLTMDDTVVGLGVMENNLVVCTASNPYVITGTHPDSMTPIKMPDPLPCLSKRGVVSFWKGVLYPSIDGLILVSAGRADNVTKQHFTKEEWANYFPTSMTGAYHDGRYFGFYDQGLFEGAGVVIDFFHNIVSTVDLGDAQSTFYGTAIYVDKRTDTLYYVKSTADVLLLEDGTGHPTREGAVLLEGGGYIILENDFI